MTKYCIDCKHFRRSTTEGLEDNMEYAKCGVAGKVSLVDGNRPLVFCESARSVTGACGEEAKLFRSSRIPDFRDGYARTTYDDRLDAAPDGRALWVEK